MIKKLLLDCSDNFGVDGLCFVDLTSWWRSRIFAQKYADWVSQALSESFPAGINIVWANCRDVACDYIFFFINRNLHGATSCCRHKHWSQRKACYTYSHLSFRMWFLMGDDNFELSCIGFVWPLPYHPGTNSSWSNEPRNISLLVRCNFHLMKRAAYLLHNLW